MAKYTKSHTNYVINEKHQVTNKGTIYERDITTIGGRDQFAPGQVPVYRTSNFVITTRGDVQKSFKANVNSGWESANGRGRDVWTKNDIVENQIDKTASNDNTITIKQDIHDIRDYAYWGSCSELFRASINDILLKFPGEFYSPLLHSKDDIVYVRVWHKYKEQAPYDINGSVTVDEEHLYMESGTDYFYSAEEIKNADLWEEYEHGSGDDGTFGFTWSTGYTGNVGILVKYDQNTDPKILGEHEVGSGKTKYYYYLLDNPFDLDLIRLTEETDENNPLKYLRSNNTYKEYELITKDGDRYDIDMEVVTLVDPEAGGISGRITTFEASQINNNLPSTSGSAEPLIKIDASEEKNTIIDKSTNPCPNEILAIIFFTFHRETFDVRYTMASEEFKKETDIGLSPSGGTGELIKVLDSKIEILERNLDDLDDEHKKLFKADIDYRKELIDRSTFVDPDKYLNDTTKYAVFAYVGDNNKVHYLIDLNEWNNLLESHIRPKEEYINNYYSNLDDFEILLANPTSYPEHSTQFKIIDENEYGYYTYHEYITFPTTYGHYNLAVDGPAYHMYLNRLIKIGEFYDERFSDNIWRAMTHEAIKNLDWSHNKRTGDVSEETFVDAYGKMEKTIRVMGRYFDDIDAYVDSLRTTNCVSYDESNNLPDYFLTDKLEEFGWEPVQILPIKLKMYGTVDNMLITSEPTSEEEKTNALKDRGYIVRKFYRDDTDEKIKPYRGNDPDTVDEGNLKYYIDCAGDKHTITSGDTKYISNGYIVENGSGETYNVIQQYASNLDYSYPEINTEFMRRLVLNSKSISRKKGTISGIESLLGMFGMKSKRYGEKANLKATIDQEESGTTITDYDYDIREYVVAIDKPLVDDIKDGVFLYDNLNTFKNIAYDTPEFRNGINIPYQGLPVIYYENDAENRRYLYPYFDSTDTYDGNPYYQMNGGWMKKFPYTFDVDNNIVSSEIIPDVYSETIKDIVTVSNIKELIEIPYFNLKDGDIVRVEDTSGMYVIIDGVVYDVFSEEIGNKKYYYFSVYVNNSTVIVGNTYFEDTITVSYPFSDTGNRRYILADGAMDYTEIKIYVNVDPIYEENTIIQAYSNTRAIKNVYLYNDNYYTKDVTDYFYIKDAYAAGEISENGWKRLSTTDKEYYLINNLRNNYKGNNPHTGGMKYDDGEEYLSYFTRLFKYAIDNDLFDESVYSNEKIDIDTLLNDFGFTIADSDTSTACDFAYKDSLKEGNGFELVQQNIDVRSKNKIAIECNMIVSGDTIRTAMEYAGDEYDRGEKTKGLYGDRIINTKIVEIDFFLNASFKDLLNPGDSEGTYKEQYSMNGQCMIKYIEDVIMPYLSEMIPSSTICRINYKTRKTNT